MTRTGRRTFPFRHLGHGCSWGLIVDLTASASVGEPPPATAEALAPGVWLSVAGSVTLPTDDAAQLRRGVLLGAPAVLARHPAPLVLDVTGVAMAMTDYQPEALLLVGLAWLGEAFDVDVPRPDVRFDRAANRYRVRI